MCKLTYFMVWFFRKAPSRLLKGLHFSDVLGCPSQVNLSIKSKWPILQVGKTWNNHGTIHGFYGKIMENYPYLFLFMILPDSS